MNLVNGFLYNLRGLRFAMKSGKLLFWGLMRFFLVLAITVILAGLVLAYHRPLLDLIWIRPESPWIQWLWYLLSWALTLFLVGVSAVFSFLVSQILFSVVIMDTMSRITERLVKGHILEPEGMTLFKTFTHLIRQEIPRTILPVLTSLVIMILGWLVVFLAPFIVVFSSCLAVTFLSWDNTDLTPARRLLPFRERWRFFLRNLPFHLGFGLPFLIPGLNLVFLSYAPVGATLYYLDRQEPEKPQP